MYQVTFGVYATSEKDTKEYPDWGTALIAAEAASRVAHLLGWTRHPSWEEVVTSCDHY
jgi:hypothetical protein